MAYNRGRAFAIGLTNQHAGNTFSFRQFFWRSVNFVRYCFHGDMPPAAALRAWRGHPLSYLLLIAAVPPALLLIVRDRYRGTLEKTHLSFDKAKARVKIS